MIKHIPGVLFMLLLLLGLSFAGDASAACKGRFNDAPRGHPWCEQIERMAELKLTSGCRPGYSCPDAPLTRGQLAVTLSGLFKGNVRVPAHTFRFYLTPEK